MTQSYLDYNATSPLRPVARIAMLAAMDAGPLNASAIHGFGRLGRKNIEDARAKIGALLGVSPAQIVFNSGATEGNNTLIKYFEKMYADEKILLSAIEHPSVQDCAANEEIIPVDRDGVLKYDWLEHRLRNGPKVCLISVMIVNNESGVIQDIPALAALAHRYGALLHTDATQAVGRIPLSMAALGADFVTLSSHKLGGPQGVGALVMNNCGVTPVLLQGGGQEKSARAGTENVAGIVGFGAAAQDALENLNSYSRLTDWRDQMEAELLRISPEIILHARSAPRIGNTTFFSFPPKDSQSLLMAFDLEGIALSNGSACSSGTVKPSAVLMAMGFSEKHAMSALRVSTGWATTEGDITAFVNAWAKIYKRIKT